MEIKDLVFFQRVVETKSVSKAADELFISQSQVSRVISALERELGVDLFERKGHKLEVNQCGETFYKDAVAITDLCAKAVDRVRKANADMRASIFFMSNIEGSTRQFMTEAGRDIDKNSIFLSAAPLKEIVRALRDDATTFGVTMPALKDPGFHTEVIHEDDLAACVYEGHWACDRPTISISELKNERFVLALRGYGSREAAESAFMAADFAPHIAIETWDTKTSLEYVRSGMGITVCRDAVSQMPRYGNLRLIPFEENLPKPSIGISWKADRQLTAEEEAFVEATRALFADEDPNS